MTIAVQVSPANAALKAAQAILVKVGNPYHDPANGEFTSGPGGGGPRGDGTPFSGKIAAKNAELQTALREHNMYLRSGDTNSSEAVAARQHVETIQIQLRSLRAQRTAALLQQSKTSTQHDTGGAPYGSIPSNVDLGAAARLAENARRSEAHRLAMAGQERRRQAGLLGSIEDVGGTAPTYGSSTYRVGDANYSRSTGTAGSAQGLRQALIDTSARVSRAAAAVQVIATNLHGATATSDYSRIGAHLNQVKSNINALSSELKGLPADTRVLYREVSNSLSRARASVDRLARTVQSKVTGKKKK